MKKVLALLVALALSTPAQSQVGFGGMFPGPGTPASAGGGVCADYTTFLARTSGTSVNEQTAYQKIICDGETHGWFQLCPIVHMEGTKDTTTAALNLVSTSFGMGTHGIPTFTADQGYTGDASTTYLSPSFNPTAAGTAFATNSATMGVYIVNSRTTGQDWFDAGANDAGGSIFYSVVPKYTDNNAYGQFSGNASAAMTNAQGMTVVTRTSASAMALYKNGSVVNSTSNASGSMPNDNLYVLAVNDGSGNAAHPSGDTVFFSMFCSGLTAQNVQDAYTDVHAAAVALGNP